MIISAYDKVMESRKEVVNKLLLLMDSGIYHNEKLWKSKALCPFNPESNTSYRGSNRLRLMLEMLITGYDDFRWCTFIQLKNAGYKLKANSKGTLCEKWIYPEETLANMSAEKKEKLTAEEIKEFLAKLPKVSFFYVFNASQIIDYPKLPERKLLEQDELTELADEIILNSECPIMEGSLQGAYYNTRKDEIHIPSRTKTIKESKR